MRKFVLAVALAVMLAFTAAAQAVSTQTFSTSQSEFTAGVDNQGWWSPTAPNDDSNDNYIAGRRLDGIHRNFFTFDLSFACRASSVTLLLTRFDQTGPLTYSLFDVSTPAATLNANNGTSQTIFDDLGSGTGFGSFPVVGGVATDVLSFPLNAAGIAAFNAARGGFFSVGGWTSDAASVDDSYLYGASSSSGTQALVVTCLPTTTTECKNGGWRDFGSSFRNQGQCVTSVNRGKP